MKLKIKNPERYLKNLYLSSNNGKLKEMKDESFRFPNITVNQEDYLKHIAWIKINFDKK